MKTEIINDSEPSAAAPVEYPALYKHEDGDVVLAYNELHGVIIHPADDGFYSFGKHLNGKHCNPWCEMPLEWTRLTTPITIKFTP